MESYPTAPIILSVIVGSVATVIALKFLKKYMSGGVCHCKTRLDGKTVIITGCNTGIGKETAKDIVSRGARVIMACRNLEKTQVAAADIRNETGCGERLVEMKLDLSDLQSVRDFAAEINKKEKYLHILINNAGVMWTPFEKTKDGFELQMGTNHFGHFLLTMLLLDLLKKSAPSRIVNVSSLAHKMGHINFDDINCERSYNRIQAYSDSKLANILFTVELAKRLEGSNVTAHSVHPGVVDTELARNIFELFPFISPEKLRYLLKYVGFLFVKSAQQGAQTSIHCAVSDKCGSTSGLYYSDCAPKRPSVKMTNSLTSKFWDLSMKMVNLNKEDN